MAFEKGHKKLGGIKKGEKHKKTVEFNDAVNRLIAYATPEMTNWLTAVAQEDPNKALDHVYKFAQFGYPLLARTENTSTNYNHETEVELDDESRERVKKEILRRLGQETKP